MPSVLITAYGPYDHWETNASWLALVELTKNPPDQPEITTRLYPVDFATLKERLAEDLAANYDVAIHLGQAPGAAHVQLEAVGLNVGGTREQRPEEFGPLAEDGPIAYRSGLPLAAWADKLRKGGVPAQVSYHAGTYLCNAALYLSHYYAQRMGLNTQSAFLHVPLDTSQVADDGPCMPSPTTAGAILMLLEEIARMA